MTAASSSTSTSTSKNNTLASSLPYLLLSLLFHLLYLSSIFQIYFTSPVVHPEKRFSLIDTYPSVALQQSEATASPPFSSLDQSIRDAAPPAERLVLIVGDGLRADTVLGKHAFNSLPEWAKFQILDSKFQNRGQKELTFPNALLEDRSLSTHQKQQLTAFENSRSDGDSGETHQVAPYIRRMALERGAWGISHTRVPTESRPGHVAMIAGMYEDVSAVTKGWKQNPLPFDSVLNQSSNTFAFGSPDIVPMFSRGATPGKVRQWCYKEEDEDFTRDATHLDLWVLNEFRNLLDSSKSSPSLASSLKERGNIFFLHLLGPDTTGHTYRPFSPEYLGNTIVVDSIVQEVERLMKNYFKDDKTAFVFTADHGMSKLGNHGDGESDNTRTPLVAWGSGVRKPRILGDETITNGRKRFGSTDHQDRNQTWRIEERSKDEYFRGWDEFDEIWREDVEQGDITPLMASLLAIPQPANSEGRLPLDYLDPGLGDEHKARASLANALQVLESYRVKDAQRSSKSLAYQPFPALAPGPAPFRLPGSEQVSRIKAHIATKKYAQALTLCDELITSSLEGAQYLQTYDWLLLVSIVTLGYLGSVFYGIIFVSRKYALLPQELEICPESLGAGSAIAALGLSVIGLKFFLEESPITYYLYAAFPAFFWGRVIDQRNVLMILLRRLLSSNPNHSTANLQSPSFSTSNTFKTLSKLIIPLGLSLFALELIVIGYLHRVAWTIGFFALGFVWPFWGWSSETRKRNEALVLVWGMACTSTAMFTLAGTEKEESRVGLALSGLVFLVAGLVILSHPSLFLSASDENADSRLKLWRESSGATSRVKKPANSVSKKAEEQQEVDPHLERTVKVVGGELVILVISTLVTLSSSRSLQLKKGLPLFNQLIGWGVLASCLTLPFFMGFQSPRALGSNPNVKIAQPISQRLAIFIFAFAPVFVLLSLRDETLFFFSYIATLLLWSKVEGTLCEESLRETIVQESLEEIRQEEQRNGKVIGKEEKTKRKEDSQTRVLRSSEIRTSLTFLFLLHVGFFGTGNVASISSFYLSPVYRLVPIFNPFLMATLLLLKILVPFVILSSIFQVLCLSPTRAPPQTSRAALENTRSNRELKASLMEGPDLLGKNSSGGLGLRDSFSLTLIACICADILALNFLFTVRTDGSWLEIGRTITHFAMANLLQIFMLALATLSEVVMGKGNLNA